MLKQSTLRSISLKFQFAIISLKNREAVIKITYIKNEFKLRMNKSNSLCFYSVTKRRKNKKKIFLLLF